LVGGLTATWATTGSRAGSRRASSAVLVNGIDWPSGPRHAPCDETHLTADC
jgi:hypothetical protein